MDEKRFSVEFFLTAAEVNAQREMPLSRLVTTVIDVATGHANKLGIGFERMIKSGISWVLSRLTIDIETMPSVNRSYRMTTWIESANRIYSERCFSLVDVAEDREIAKAHSIWMAIDMATRRPGDLSGLWAGRDMIDGTSYEGDKGGKLQPLREADVERNYRFAVSDIDVNRHVTTRRYIDLIVDLWPLEHYEQNLISRFEVAFKHEAHYDEEATAARSSHEGSPEVADVEISVAQTPCCLARMKFRYR